MQCGRRQIFASSQFIPFIVRKSVAVHIQRYHDNTRLARTCLIILKSNLIKSVPTYQEVVFSWDIHNRMIESKRNITTICPERNQLVGSSGNTILNLLQHISTGITSLPIWHLVNELSRRGAIFMDFGYIRAIFHFLMNNPHRKIMPQCSVFIKNLYGHSISPFLGCKKQAIACFRQDVLRTVRVCTCPYI